MLHTNNVHYMSYSKPMHMYIHVYPLLHGTTIHMGIHIVLHVCVLKYVPVFVSIGAEEEAHWQ